MGTGSGPPHPLPVRRHLHTLSRNLLHYRISTAFFTFR